MIPIYHSKVTVLIRINTASSKRLSLIPGVGQKNAEAIVRQPEQFGHVTKEALSLLFMGELPIEVYSIMDFNIPSPAQDL